MTSPQPSSATAPVQAPDHTLVSSMGSMSIAQQPEQSIAYAISNSQSPPPGTTPSPQSLQSPIRKPVAQSPSQVQYQQIPMQQASHTSPSAVIHGLPGSIASQPGHPHTQQQSGMLPQQQAVQHTDPSNTTVPQQMYHHQAQPANMSNQQPHYQAISPQTMSQQQLQQQPLQQQPLQQQPLQQQPLQQQPLQQPLQFNTPVAMSGNQPHGPTATAGVLQTSQTQQYTYAQAQTQAQYPQPPTQMATSPPIVDHRSLYRTNSVPLQNSINTSPINSTQQVPSARHMSYGTNVYQPPYVQNSSPQQAFTNSPQPLSPQQQQYSSFQQPLQSGLRQSGNQTTTSPPIGYGVQSYPSPPPSAPLSGVPQMMKPQSPQQLNTPPLSAGMLGAAQPLVTQQVLQGSYQNGGVPAGQFSVQSQRPMTNYVQQNPQPQNQTQSQFPTTVNSSYGSQTPQQNNLNTPQTQFANQMQQPLQSPQGTYAGFVQPTAMVQSTTTSVSQYQAPNQNQLPPPMTQVMTQSNTFSSARIMPGAKTAATKALTGMKGFLNSNTGKKVAFGVGGAIVEGAGLANGVDLSGGIAVANKAFKGYATNQARQQAKPSNNQINTSNTTQNPTLHASQQNPQQMQNDVQKIVHGVAQQIAHSNAQQNTQQVNASSSVPPNGSYFPQQQQQPQQQYNQNQNSTAQWPQNSSLTGGGNNSSVAMQGDQSNAQQFSPQGSLQQNQTQQYPQQYSQQQNQQQSYPQQAPQQQYTQQQGPYQAYPPQQQQFYQQPQPVYYQQQQQQPPPQTYTVQTDPSLQYVQQQDPSQQSLISNTLPSQDSSSSPPLLQSPQPQDPAQQSSLLQNFLPQGSSSLDPSQQPSQGQDPSQLFQGLQDTSNQGSFQQNLNDPNIFDTNPSRSNSPGGSFTAANQSPLGFSFLNGQSSQPQQLQQSLNSTPPPTNISIINDNFYMNNMSSQPNDSLTSDNNAITDLSSLVPPSMSPTPSTVDQNDSQTFSVGSNTNTQFLNGSDGGLGIENFNDNASISSANNTTFQPQMQVMDNETDNASQLAPGFVDNDDY